jgi:hyperosmotically inducible protein
MKFNPLPIVALCGALLSGCNREPNDQSTSTADRNVGSAAPNSRGTAAQTEPAPVAKSPNAAPDAIKPPDNTGRNVRDRSDAAVTPGTQSEASADVETTRRVRQALTGDAQLSTLAKNIKVIDTGNGKIVLRGPVNSDAERQKIDQLAKSVPGVTEIDNQLEVKANQ